MFGISYVRDFFLIVGDDHLAVLLLHADTSAMLGDDLRVVQGCQHLTGLDLRLILDRELPFFGNAVFVADQFAVFDADFAQVGIFFRLIDAQRAADLCDDGFTLRLFAGFEEFFHAWETGRDVCAAGSHTTGVEGAQRQLCARLADGLGSHDTDCGTEFHHGAASQVETIALGTNAVLQFAGHRRTDLDFINTGSSDLASQFLVDHIVVFTDDFSGLRVDHVFSQQAAVETAAQSLTGNIVLAADVDAIVRAAVMFVDDDVLGNIHEAAGQITGICCTQSGIRQTFARAVCGDEVFLRRQSFTEVRADRHRDDAPGRISHQTAHTSQLRNGGETTFGRAGGCHGGKIPIRIHVPLDGICHTVGGALPDLDLALVLFLFGQQTAAEIALDHFHCFERILR